MSDTADTAPIPAAVQTATAPAKWNETTITLAFPVTLGETTFAKLTLVEPDVEALEAIEGLGITEGATPTVKQSRLMIAIIARVDPAVIGKLNRRDFEKAVEALAPLLGGAE